MVFNGAIAARREAYEAGKKMPTASELCKLLVTEAKKTPERGWLASVSAVVLQQAFRDADQAYKNFFDSMSGKRAGRKVGAPRFKTRRDRRQAVRFTANARWSVTAGGKLRLPKIGDVPVQWSRALPSAASSVTVIKDAAGRYFASFVVDASPESIETEAPEIGVDLGLGHFAVLSDGTKIKAPKFLRNAERKLKRAQRNLSRKQKDSNNRDKARIKLARAHARVADARREFHHQLSTQLIRENQAIAVEDLVVSGLARTRLAKSVHDAGWSAFVAMLEYKAALYGRSVVRIDRFEPTSQVCSNCGTKDGPKPLHVRVWRCQECGTHLDRDINAAVNVAKAAGLAVTACGAHVSPERVRAERGEAGTHRGDLASAEPRAARRGRNHRPLRTGEEVNCCLSTL
ncbi:putative transposase [Saccharopolyspora antimicrobica]|uniref:Putative transposase n=1 Tax=Saccharopolyspora antimicrobica TaxID=455193 RepID=A0A1I4RNZ3_9PSEU|nr:putative transposase [Saccharopolyspora antimicrobica]